MATSTAAPRVKYRRESARAEWPLPRPSREPAPRREPRAPVLPPAPMIPPPVVPTALRRAQRKQTAKADIESLLLDEIKRLREAVDRLASMLERLYDSRSPLSPEGEVGAQPPRS
ncbi:MAG TPA: hypothetical protein VHS99_21425 [Chloroflexota bacterium]|jgi:hypothetical protein|nr:hypothetical protein [Chloroflexota bacterium]